MSQSMDSLHAELFGDGGTPTPQGTPGRLIPSMRPPPSPGLRTPPRVSNDFINQAKEWKKRNPNLMPGSPLSPSTYQSPAHPRHPMAGYPSDLALAHPMSAVDAYGGDKKFQFSSALPGETYSTPPRKPAATEVDPEYYSEVGLPTPGGDSLEYTPQDVYEDYGLTPLSSEDDDGGPVISQKSAVASTSALSEIARVTAELTDSNAENRVLADEIAKQSHKLAAAEAANQALSAEIAALKAAFEREHARATELSVQNSSLHAEVAQLSHAVKSTPAAPHGDSGGPSIADKSQAAILFAQLGGVRQACASLRNEMSALTTDTANSLSLLMTPIQSLGRQLSARLDAAVSHGKLLHALYTSAAASRREAYDQMWSHHPAGSIRVIARIAPASEVNSRLNKHTSPSGGLQVSYDGDTRSVVVKEKGQQRQFQMDRVFDAGTPLFAALCDIDALAHNVLEGDSACVFLASSGDTALDVATTAHHRALKALFSALPSADMPSSHASHRVTLSYVDVVMERGYDMLSLSGQSPSLDDPTACLTVVESKKLEEAALVARTGVRRRAEAAATRGDSILRSHGVLTICVTLFDGISGQETSGKLHIVELSSGVRAAVSHGGALHSSELVADPSLAAFSELAATVRGGNRINASRGSPSPFEHSRLTSMLQDSFGNGKASLLFASVPEVMPSSVALDAIRALNLAAKIAASGSSGSGIPALNTSQASEDHSYRPHRDEAHRSITRPVPQSHKSVTASHRSGTNRSVSPRVGATSGAVKPSTNGRSNASKPSQPSPTRSSSVRKVPYQPSASSATPASSVSGRQHASTPSLQQFQQIPVGQMLSSSFQRPDVLTTPQPHPPPLVPQSATTATTTPPTIIGKDPVPGMKRLLMAFRRKGRFDGLRTHRLVKSFSQADGGRTGSLDASGFVSALHNFDPSISLDELYRIVEAMHLKGAPSIDYMDFVAALGVLAGEDGSASTGPFGDEHPLNITAPVAFAPRSPRSPRGSFSASRPRPDGNARAVTPTARQSAAFGSSVPTRRALNRSLSSEREARGWNSSLRR